MRHESAARHPRARARSVSRTRTRPARPRSYLPKRSSDQFKKRWESIVGRKYGNTKMELDAATVKKLPVVTFVFEENVAVEVQPGAYMEKAGGKYVPRIYLTEGSGAVLGGNFMQDHDVFFDAGQSRALVSQLNSRGLTDSRPLPFPQRTGASASPKQTARTKRTKHNVALLFPYGPLLEFCCWRRLHL